MSDPADETDPGPAAAVPLRLSEVRRLTGVEVDTLRMLVEDKLLEHGVERARNGHVYLRSDSVPTHADLVELLRSRLAHELMSARKHMARVEVELEAVRNDLELAAQDPEAPLGHDLLTLRVWSNDPRDTTLTSALRGLESAVWAVRRYQDAVKQATSVSPSQVD